MNPTLGHQQKGKQVPKPKKTSPKIELTGPQIVENWLANCVMEAECDGYQQAEDTNAPWYQALDERPPMWSSDDDGHLDVRFFDGREFRVTITEIKKK